MYLFSALLLTWENELGISRNNLTFIYSLGLVVHSLLLPFLGKIVDRNLSFPMMWTSPILLGLSVIYLSSVDTYGGFLLAWILVSATSGGCLYTMLFSVITINLKSKAKTSIAIITLFAGFASTYTFPTATYLTEQYDWRFTVFIFGILNILISSPANYFGFKNIILKEFKKIEKKTDQNSKIKIILKDFRFWLFSFSLFVIGFNIGAITTHVIPMLQEKGMSLSQAVLTASLFGPGQVIGRILVMIYGSDKSNLKLFVICFYSICLLYTSDAADDSLRVDLGGRRIIKKPANGGLSHWWRGEGLNFRPSGYEPDELPDCSTPRYIHSIHLNGFFFIFF